MVLWMLALIAWPAQEADTVAAAAAEAEGLAGRIVAFAESKLGEKVGDGQCSGLAVEALREAGARLGGGAGEEPWGDRLDPNEPARPGDILVFKDAVFVRKQVMRNGAVRTTTATMAHHVAIVSGVQRRPGAVRVAVLHQNAGRTGAADDRRQVVQRWVLDPGELQGGTVHVYRPVPADTPPTAGEAASPR